MIRRLLIVVLTLVVLVVGVVLVAGCEPAPLLHDVSIRPTTISPNADGTDDIAELKYSVSRQANVSIHLIDADGQRHTFRDRKRRSEGDRTAYFGGVIDGSLLPDGDYTVLFEAVDQSGQQERLEKQITLHNGDPVHLRIENLNIWPKAFTPNRDGITDRVTVAYNLNKEATWVDVYLLDEQGTKYPVPEDKIREMGAAGSHEHDYDAGVDLGAMPPDDGEYTVVVEAEDAVGNKDRVEGKLTISGGGVPHVAVVNRAARFSPQVLPLGSTLTFTCTVKNTGRVPVRTIGPEPGTVYDTATNFNTLGAYEEPGAFRIGLDYEGNADGRMYPFRWQLGMDEELTVIDTEIGPQKYLMPGQTVTVVGHLRVLEKPFKTNPYYWLGLIHEQVEIVQDRIEPTSISLGF